MPLIDHKRHDSGYRHGSDPSHAVGFVYAVWDGESIKVGSTSREHPKLRCRHLQTGSSRLLRLVAYRLVERGQVPLDVERAMHKKLWHSHLRAEWFRVTLRVLAEINGWDWCDMYYIDMLRIGLGLRSPCHAG